jgi:hypothetical protein
MAGHNCVGSIDGEAIAGRQKRAHQNELRSLGYQTLLWIILAFANVLVPTATAGPQL